MLEMIVSAWIAIAGLLLAVYALVREVRIINAHNAAERKERATMRKEIHLLLEENMLTSVSPNSVHGVPELNRWPVKPVPPPPKVSRWAKVKAKWAWFVRWWRRLVNLDGQ